MATERITTILNSVSQRVEKLVPSGRFYVVLYDSKKKELSFPLVREDEKGLSKWDARPWRSDDTLPDLVIAKAKSLLYENDLLSRFENGEIHYWPDEKKVPRSWLGIPLVMGEQVLGALVVESWQKTYSFNKNDQSTLATVARQASIAIENVRLYEQLDRKIENLRILNDTGQQLTHGLVKQEGEILAIIRDSLTKLHLDTRNMYIAFYDPDPYTPNTAEEIYGMIRIGAALNLEQKSPFENRAAQKGLTEYIIRTQKSFRPVDVEKAYEEFAPDSIQRSRLSRARSWLGVPVISMDQVFGVIVLRNYEFEQVYTQDDQEILELLAGQTAIALQNLRTYQAQKEVEEQERATENMAIMGITAAEFAHKMNNLAGTIPVRIDMAESLLDGNDPKNKKMIEHLEKIRSEADGILSAAKEIRESTEPRAPEEINVNQLLETAIAIAENTRQNIQSKVNILKEFAEDLPLTQAERNSFLNTLTSIIKNGIEAIDVQGTVTIKTRCAHHAQREFIEIEVFDTGRGIPSSELSKVFGLFYTTKGKKGLGFGLWRDRTFIKRLGGEIGVQSEVGKGSIFTIRIPVITSS